MVTGDEAVGEARYSSRKHLGPLATTMASSLSSSETLSMQCLCTSLLLCSTHARTDPTGTLHTCRPVASSRWMQEKNQELGAGAGLPANFLDLPTINSVLNFPLTTL